MTTPMTAPPLALPPAPPAAPDAALYAGYEQCINPAYPAFLRRLGLDHAAARAEGALIHDTAGRTYIDCLGGYGIFALGHNHPRIVAALIDQLRQNQLLTRPLIGAVQVRLAQRLAALAPRGLTCSYVCNSGAEAVETALKLVRLNRGDRRIVAAQHAFHGATLGALAVSGIPSFTRVFGTPHPGVHPGVGAGVVHVPFGASAALEALDGSRIGAVLLEPIQHERGIILPPAGYLAAVRRWCDRHGALLVLDEVVTGMGKTGRMFACEHEGVTPDVLVLGKALGGGLMPIGAVLARPELWHRFGLSFAMSASAFAGNVLAAQAALATLDVIEEERLLDAAAEKGRWLLAALRAVAGRCPQLIKEVRGLGMMLAIETASPATALALSRRLIAAGVLVLPAFGNPAVLMVEPPLVITREQMRQVVEAFAAATEGVR